MRPVNKKFFIRMVVESAFSRNLLTPGQPGPDQDQIVFDDYTQ